MNKFHTRTARPTKAQGT